MPFTAAEAAATGGGAGAAARAAAAGLRFCTAQLSSAQYKTGSCTLVLLLVLLLRHRCASYSHYVTTTGTSTSIGPTGIGTSSYRCLAVPRYCGSVLGYYY
jgi:hypothetical protein